MKTKLTPFLHERSNKLRLSCSTQQQTISTVSSTTTSKLRRAIQSQEIYRAEQAARTWNWI